MTTHLIKESAATAVTHFAEDGVATGVSEQTAELLAKSLKKRGPFMAAVILSAALTSGSATGMAPLVMNTARRREDASAESGTAFTEHDQELFEQISELFEEGSGEFFLDGMRSAFSNRLLALVGRYHRAAFYAIAEYLFSAETDPDVVSEALRWLADFNDPSTFAQRWAILQHTIRDRSPRVRDGAILGFAALDDPRARPVLTASRDVEQIAELQRLIDKVIRQLDATADAAATANR